MPMFTVYFFENKEILLNQLLKQAPLIGEEVKIKGQKGKILNVIHIDDKNIHVQVQLNKVNKNKPILDNSKKKK